MNQIDMNFLNKNTFRFIFMQKTNIYKNIYKLPKIKKIICYFFFNKLENLDNVQLFNSYYLFKFFFGKKAYYTKTKSFYILGKWFNNLNIQIIYTKKKEIFEFLFYIKNNIINYCSTFITTKFINKCFYILINDLKIFSELKTNLGLFNLNDKLNFKIFLTGGENITNKEFIKILKL